MSDLTLTLTAPAPVAPVELRQAAGLVPISDQTRSELQGKVDRFVADLVACNPQSPEFGTRVGQLTNIGQKEITTLASQSNRFLDRPTRGMGAEGGVGKALIDLRGIIDNLDPGRQGDLLKPRKLLGIIPFGSKLQAYFDRYTSAQSHIQSILAGLARGKDELIMDNAAINTERGHLYDGMQKLEQVIFIARQLDATIEAKAADLDMTDPAKARALRESGLFYVRQRQTDLLTQMAVTVQGYLALDLIKKNNVELIKGVDRASTTTIAALRTAVTVAQALNNQRLVLNQISALNSTTANMIECTGKLLRENTAAINEQASSATIQVEVLQRAFAHIYATMESIDTFKLQALDNMKTTVEALSAETQKAQSYLHRSRGARQGQSADPILSLS